MFLFSFPSVSMEPIPIDDGKNIKKRVVIVSSTVSGKLGTMIMNK